MSGGVLRADEELLEPDPREPAHLRLPPGLLQQLLRGRREHVQAGRLTPGLGARGVDDSGDINLEGDYLGPVLALYCSEDGWTLVN